MEDAIREADGSKTCMSFLAEPILSEECCNIVLECARTYMPGRVLLMDTTFGTNNLGYKLLTALVADDHGCGLPVVFAILKNENQVEFTHAIQAFKEAVTRDSTGSTFDPHTVLTDFDWAEKNAVTAVFPEAKQGLCFFHVRRAWLKRVTEKVKALPEAHDKQASMKKQVRSILAALKDIMYMMPHDTLAYTVAAVKEEFRMLCAKYVLAAEPLYEVQLQSSCHHYAVHCCPHVCCVTQMSMSCTGSRRLSPR